MDGKRENSLSGKQHDKQSKHRRFLKQKSVNDDYCARMKTKIPAVERRYSSPSGECLKPNVQRQDSTEKAEIIKGFQPEVALDEAAESLVCEICDISFTNLSQYNVHVGSKSHRRTITGKKSKGVLSFFEKKNAPAENCPTLSNPHSFCTVCQKNFFELEDYLQHLQKKSHKKRISLQKIFSRINADLTGSEDDDEIGERGAAEQINARRRCSSIGYFTTIGDDCFECKYCDKVFEGHVPFAHHIASKFHEKAKRRNGLLAELSNLLTEESEEDCSPSSKGGRNRKTSSE